MEGHEKKGGSPATIIGILVVVALIIGGFFMFRGQNASDAENTQPTGASSAETADLTGLTPTEVYVKMKQDLAAATSFDDILNTLLAYTTEENKALSAADFEEYKAAPREQKDALLALYRQVNPPLSEITDMEESVDGDRATITLGTAKPDQKGSATFVREDGVWKVEAETWQTGAGN